MIKKSLTTRQHNDIQNYLPYHFVNSHSLFIIKHEMLIINLFYTVNIVFELLAHRSYSTQGQLTTTEYYFPMYERNKPFRVQSSQ